MKMILKFTLLAIFSGLFLLQTAATAQSGGSGKPGGSNKSTTSEIEFPDIDGWERSEIQKYPMAELGYSVAYQSQEGGTVTIYVYNGGQSNIPDDINDKIIKKEMEKAKNDIVQIGKAGIYENVKEIKSDTITLGGTSGKVKSLRSLFSFTARGQDVDSEIYLFGYQNNFIKIRATRPKAKNNAENKVFTKFLAELDNLFSGEGKTDQRTVATF